MLKNTESDCPSCKTAFKKPINKQGFLFCPHCNIHLIKNDNSNQQNHKADRLKPKSLIANNTEQPKSLRKQFSLTNILKHLGYSFLLAVLMSILYIASSRFIHLSSSSTQFTVLAVLLLLIVFDKLIGLDKLWAKLSANKTAEPATKPPTKNILYTSGIDTLTECTDDNFCYKPIINDATNYKAQCTECASYRMSDLYWYNRLTDSQTSISDLRSLNIDEADFIGCLRCHTRYHIQYNNYRSKAFICLLLYAIIFLGLLLVSYQTLNVYIENMLASINSDINQLMAILLPMWIFPFFQLLPKFFSTKLITTCHLHNLSPSK